MSETSFYYEIKGTKSSLSKVADTILAFREQFAERVDVNPYPVTTDADGNMYWMGTLPSPMFELDDDLMALTRRSATKILVYQGEDSDSYIEGCVRLMEKGKYSTLEYWQADVGFDAAMASIKLEETADVHAAGRLLKSLEKACRQPGRLSAVLAQMLLEALDRHPSLAEDEGIWSRISAIRPQIDASDFWSETADGDLGTNPCRIGQLFADIEAKKLASGLMERTGEACPPKDARL